MNRNDISNIQSAQQFFYSINYSEEINQLCAMEMKYLFDTILENKKKYLICNRKIDSSRSVHIKARIDILCAANSLEELISQVAEQRFTYDQFKIWYVKSMEGDAEYTERLKSLGMIASKIHGSVEIHHPKVNLAVTKVRDRWLFGEYKKNDYKWLRHEEKPHSYSNALSLRMARTVVNIAVGRDLNTTLVDPCCGVGTVVLEALDLGVPVKGYEISKPTAFNARNNIEFFGYERDTILRGDMHEIQKVYDVSIVDIPYGLYTQTTPEEQQEILKTSRRISKKLILVSFEKMDKQIIEAGFKIIDFCEVSKGKFKRYITICS